jgi:hypothetical protein
MRQPHTKYNYNGPANSSMYPDKHGSLEAHRGERGSSPTSVEPLDVHAIVSRVSARLLFVSVFLIKAPSSETSVRIVPTEGSAEVRATTSSGTAPRGKGCGQRLVLPPACSHHVCVLASFHALAPPGLTVCVLVPGFPAPLFADMPGRRSCPRRGYCPCLSAPQRRACPLPLFPSPFTRAARDVSEL